MDIKIKEVASLLFRLSRKKEPIKYKGRLNEKIKLTDVLSSSEEFFYMPRHTERHTIEIITQIYENIPLLFQHYNVDPNHTDAWQTLAIKLAHAHVKGFQPFVQKGRPKVSTTNTLCKFYRFYNHYKAGKIENIFANT